MLTHFFKIAWRNLLKHKTFSAINLMGLAIGFLCVLFIFLYVYNELSFDRYHAQADKIFRVGYEVASANEPAKKLAWVSALAGPMLKAEYPEIVEIARFRNIGAQVEYGGKRFTERKIFYADAAAFKVFSFKFLQGDPEVALQHPYTAVLTRAMAEKYFGVEAALGKTLTVDDTLKYQVTGVIENVPENSHFTFDLLFSHATREILSPFIRHWFALGTHTYLLTNGQITAAALESKISGAVMKHFAEEAGTMGIGIKLFVQPLTDIHLHSDLQMEIAPNNSATLVYIFAVIAVLILLIACCNFINLSTARFVRRAKEVGIRKVGG
ncbi:MAG: ABC transporter permease, partial [bacterium]